MLDRSRPFLLTAPEYGGTLAAARCLGERGIPVTMAGSSVLAPARWSRHATRWVHAPSLGEPERFVEWLLEFGRREPGHVLYPTCDDLAWLLARDEAELSRYFELYQPSADTILQLLDKSALQRRCEQVGIATLPTAFPCSEAEAVEAGRALGYPILLKPRTQVLFRTHSKGRLVERAEGLLKNYREYVTENDHHPDLVARVPDIVHPMMQVYRPDAATGIYSLSGFVGRGDQGIAARAAIKVLQRPRGFGVGVCFEEAAVDGELLAAVQRLCKAVGYFGVFESEFIRCDGRLRIIDFNPRFYGQMGFDVARDLPLAYLVWLGACGEDEVLASALSAARSWLEGRGYAYCHRFFLEMVLVLQRLSGKMDEREVTRWRGWMNDHRARGLMVDAAASGADHLPGIVSAVNEIYRIGRYPRSFVRSIVLDAM